MLETFTSKARPTAASHAANTKIKIGIGIEIIELVFRIIIEVIINKESIIPSKHSKVDIRCVRNIRVPMRDKMKDKVRLRKAGVILVIMSMIII